MYECVWGGNEEGGGEEEEEEGVEDAREWCGGGGGIGGIQLDRAGDCGEWVTMVTLLAKI